MRFFGNAIVAVCFTPLISSANGYAKIGSNSGVCGLSNDATLNSKPTSELFCTGTTPIISGSGPRTWACAGTSEGTTVRRSAIFSASLGSCPFSATGSATVFNPNDPAASGYGLVFDDEFNTPATVSFSPIVTSGYNWYTQKFFGFKTTPASDIAFNNGVMTLNSTARGVIGGDISYALATAAPADNAQGWIGKVFGGGGYFEARVSFDPATVNKANGWPAFWSMAVQHLAQKGASHWPGQPKGYEHYIEDDFFEYGKWSGVNTYTTTLHDWHGKWQASCASGGCDVNNGTTATITLPSTTDWKSFHTIAQLWIPTTANGGTGHVRNYFDGNLMSTAIWKRLKVDSPPPSGESLFSIIDQQSLALIIGTGQNQPMNVDWVHVWQLPAAAAASGNSMISPQLGFTGANGACSSSSP